MKWIINRQNIKTTFSVIGGILIPRKANILWPDSIVSNEAVIVGAKKSGEERERERKSLWDSRYFQCYLNNKFLICKL